MSSTKRTRLSLNSWAEVYAAMGNPIRLGILFILYSSEFTGDTPCLRYSQIKAITGIASDSALTHHLGRLVKAGLVTKDAYKDEDNQVFPIYASSERWDRIVESSGLSTVIHEIIAE